MNILNLLIKKANGAAPTPADKKQAQSSAGENATGTPGTVKYVPSQKRPRFTVARRKSTEETTPNYIVSEPKAPPVDMSAIGGGAKATSPTGTVKYAPSQKQPIFTVARRKSTEETTPNYIVSEPKAPSIDIPDLRVNAGVIPVDIGDIDVPALATAKVEAPNMSPASLGPDIEERRKLYARAPLSTNKVNAPKPAVDTLTTEGGDGVIPVDIGDIDVPALPTYEVTAPNMSPASLGPDIEERRKLYARAPKPVAPAAPVQPKGNPLTGGKANDWRANAAAGLGKAAPGIASMHTGVRGGMLPSTPTPAPASTPVVAPTPSGPSAALPREANDMMRGKGLPAPKPVADAPIDLSKISRKDMAKYRKHTGAVDMNSEMDRWKTYQAMNGNPNASNADYYAWKRKQRAQAKK